jgi:drug/metabolite transporter (DMT)-like permease
VTADVQHARVAAAARYKSRLTAALTAVYLIWGTSFMFSKIGVSHLPSTLFSAFRFIIAGTGLTLLARFWRMNAWPASARDWRDIFITGLFMVVLSNGLSIWALQSISSGESALLNSTTALWIALFGSFGRRGHPLNRMAWCGLTLGVVGTALTLSPRLALGAGVAIPYLVTLLACLCWSIATMYYRHADTHLGPLMFIGLQMLTGGLVQLTIGVALGQWPQWTFSGPGMLSLAYLAVFSSGLAYTSYGWLTRNTSPAIIGTFSYVNPAIATLVGWIFLHESLQPIQFAGMLVVLIGVALVTSSGTTPRDDKGLEEPASP